MKFGIKIHKYLLYSASYMLVFIPLALICFLIAILFSKFSTIAGFFALLFGKITAFLIYVIPILFLALVVSLFFSYFSKNKDKNILEWNLSLVIAHGLVIVIVLIVNLITDVI